MADLPTRVTRNKYIQMCIPSLCAVIGGRKRIRPDAWESGILGLEIPIMFASIPVKAAALRENTMPGVTYWVRTSSVICQLVPSDNPPDFSFSSAGWI